MSGCAQQPVWVKPGASQNDFSVDRYACLQEAQQRVGAARVNPYSGAAVNTVQTNQMLFTSCMNARGWYLQTQPKRQQQAAQQAQSNPLQDAITAFNAEIATMCRDPELQPYLVKSPCDISGATLEQLSDPSRINDQQKASLQKGRQAYIEALKKLIQAMRQYGGQKGNADASVRQKMDEQFEANLLNLYSGKIAWGEYNRRRKDLSGQMRHQIMEIWQSK